MYQLTTTSPKEEKPKRSPLPLYIAQLLWVLFCLFSPIYQLQFFIPVSILGWGAFLTFYLLIPVPKFHRIKAHAVKLLRSPEETAYTTRNQAILDCSDALVTLQQCKSQLLSGDNELFLSLTQLEKLLIQAQTIAQTNTKQAALLQTFSSHHLSALVQLLTSYLAGEHHQFPNQITTVLNQACLILHRLNESVYTQELLPLQPDLDKLSHLLTLEGISVT